MFQIDIVIFRRLQDHARRRLAPVALLVIGLDRRPFKIRAVVDGRNDAAGFGRFPAHPVVEDLHVVFRIIASGDAALVGDDDDGIALFRQIGQGLFGPVHPFKILDEAQIGFVDVEDAVAVEKDGLSHS